MQNSGRSHIYQCLHMFSLMSLRCRHKNGCLHRTLKIFFTLLLRESSYTCSFPVILHELCDKHNIYVKISCIPWLITYHLRELDIVKQDVSREFSVRKEPEIKMAKLLSDAEHKTEFLDGLQISEFSKNPNKLET